MQNIFFVVLSAFSSENFQNQEIRAADYRAVLCLAALTGYSFVFQP